MLTKNSPTLKMLPAFACKLAGNGEGLLEGYGSTFFDEPDTYGEVVARGAFTDSLSEHKKSGTSPVMLWSHNPAEPIGKWSSITEDAHGLRVRGQLELETTRGREAHALLKSGGLNGLSIGFQIDEKDVNYGNDGIRTLTRIDLWEVSIVSMPANRNARVDAVKSFQTPRELEQYLRDVGLPRAAATKIAAGGFTALDQSDSDDEAAQIVREIKSRADQLQTIIEGNNSWN